jgi:hypothetical protein
MRWRLVLAAALAWHVSASAQIREEPALHLGVASCATSICHGKITAVDDRNVKLNEYRVWSTQDRHARAYKTLGTDESKLIAQKLGLPSAQTAQECLDCHSDNVAREKRGPKFQISDGVGCEACHGGSEKWIESHTEPGVTHQANLMRGMYATENPVARAEICLSCHLGTNNQFAAHRIMGAGHPRLRFELEAFTANQPAHYTVDDDYRARKGRIEGVNLWVTGQIESAKRYLTLVNAKLFETGAAFPELALYDCQGCHHAMDDRRWSRDNVGTSIAPGTPRLQSQHFAMLEAVTSVLEPSAVAELRATVQRFVLAGQSDARGVSAAATGLAAWIAGKESAWATRQYQRMEVQEIRRQVLKAAAVGRLADYASAEQAFLAVESLTLYLGPTPGQRTALDRLFATVEKDRTYEPMRFMQTADTITREF